MHSTQVNNFLNTSSIVMNEKGRYSIPSNVDWDGRCTNVCLPLPFKEFFQVVPVILLLVMVTSGILAFVVENCDDDAIWSWHWSMGATFVGDLGHADIFTSKLVISPFATTVLWLPYPLEKEPMDPAELELLAQLISSQPTLQPLIDICLRREKIKLIQR